MNKGAFKKLKYIILFLILLLIVGGGSFYLKVRKEARQKARIQKQLEEIEALRQKAGARSYSAEEIKNQIKTLEEIHTLYQKQGFTTQKDIPTQIKELDELRK